LFRPANFQGKFAAVRRHFSDLDFSGLDDIDSFHVIAFPKKITILLIRLLYFLNACMQAHFYGKFLSCCRPFQVEPSFLRILFLVCKDYHMLGAKMKLSKVLFTLYDSSYKKLPETAADALIDEGNQP